MSVAGGELGDEGTDGCIEFGLATTLTGYMYNLPDITRAAHTRPARAKIEAVGHFSPW